MQESANAEALVDTAAEDWQRQETARVEGPFLPEHLQGRKLPRPIGVDDTGGLDDWDYREEVSLLLFCTQKISDSFKKGNRRTTLPATVGFVPRPADAC